MAVVELLGISMKIPAITHQLLRKIPIHSSFNHKQLSLVVVPHHHHQTTDTDWSMNSEQCN